MDYLALITAALIGGGRLSDGKGREMGPSAIRAAALGKAMMARKALTVPRAAQGRMVVYLGSGACPQIVNMATC